MESREEFLKNLVTNMDDSRLRDLSAAVNDEVWRRSEADRSQRLREVASRIV